VIAHFDGLCEEDPRTGRRNPGGYACGGWWFEHEGALIEGHEFYGSGDGYTNNVAEYRAAIDVLQAVYGSGWRGPVTLRGDSQLVIHQYNRSWKVNKSALQELLARLREAATVFESVTAQWVPREENERADALSRQAYEEALRASTSRRSGGGRR
jgi:ribonuclease HI